MVISFIIGVAELQEVAAWAKAHDVGRSRAIRTMVRFALANGVALDQEVDGRVSGERKRKETNK